MAEFAATVGAVSAVTTLAEQGFKLSRAIKAYVHAYKHAIIEIQRIATSIVSFSNVLEELGRVLVSRSKSLKLRDRFVSELEQSSQQCEAIFDEIWEALLAASGNRSPETTAVAVGSDKQEKYSIIALDLENISKRQKSKWPLQKEKIIDLDNDLYRLKGDLSAKLQVLAFVQLEKAREVKAQRTAIRMQIYQLQLEEERLKQKGLEMDPGEGSRIPLTPVPMNGDISPNQNLTLAALAAVPNEMSQSVPDIRIHPDIRQPEMGAASGSRERGESSQQSLPGPEPYQPPALAQETLTPIYNQPQFIQPRERPSSRDEGNPLSHGESSTQSSEQRATGTGVSRPNLNNLRTTVSSVASSGEDSILNATAPISSPRPQSLQPEPRNGSRESSIGQIDISVSDSRRKESSPDGNLDVLQASSKDKRRSLISSIFKQRFSSRRGSAKSSHDDTKSTVAPRQGQPAGKPPSQSTGDANVSDAQSDGSGFNTTTNLNIDYTYTLEIDGAHTIIDLDKPPGHVPTTILIHNTSGNRKLCIPSLLAWSLRRADPENHFTDRTWKRIHRVPLPIAFDELAAIVQKQKQKAAIWKTTSTYLTYQQQQINRLVRDRTIEEVDMAHFEWVIAAIQLVPKKARPASAVSIQVVLERKPRQGVTIVTLPPILDEVSRKLNPVNDHTAGQLANNTTYSGPAARPSANHVQDQELTIPPSDPSILPVQPYGVPPGNELVRHNDGSQMLPNGRNKPPRDPRRPKSGTKKIQLLEPSIGPPGMSGAGPQTYPWVETTVGYMHMPNQEHQQIPPPFFSSEKLQGKLMDPMFMMDRSSQPVQGYRTLGAYDSDPSQPWTSRLHGKQYNLAPENQEHQWKSPGPFDRQRKDKIPEALGNPKLSEKALPEKQLDRVSGFLKPMREGYGQIKASKLDSDLDEDSYPVGIGRDDSDKKSGFDDVERPIALREIDECYDLFQKTGMARNTRLQKKGVMIKDGITKENARTTTEELNRRETLAKAKRKQKMNQSGKSPKQANTSSDDELSDGFASEDTFSANTNARACDEKLESQKPKQTADQKSSHAGTQVVGPDEEATGVRESPGIGTGLMDKDEIERLATDWFSFDEEDE